MEMSELINSARDALSAKRVFGDPYEKDGVTIITVAKVSGGGGGGSGGDASGGQGAGRRIRDERGPGRCLRHQRWQGLLDAGSRRQPCDPRRSTGRDLHAADFPRVHAAPDAGTHDRAHRRQAALRQTPSVVDRETDGSTHLAIVGPLPMCRRMCRVAGSLVSTKRNI